MIQRNELEQKRKSSLDAMTKGKDVFVLTILISLVFFQI